MTVDKKKPNMVDQEVTKLDDEQLKDVAGGKRDDDANWDDYTETFIPGDAADFLTVKKP